MRILYSHRVGSRDGQSVHIEELVAAFRAAGHEVLIIGPGAYEEAGFGGESRLIAAVRRLLPDVVGELAELAYNIPAYLRLLRAYRAFQPDLLYERYNLFYLAGAWLARRHNVLHYSEVNAPLADERSRHGGLRLQRVAHSLERWAWRSADRVLAVSDVLKQMIANAGIPASKIEVVPNGVVLERYRAEPRPPAPEPLVLGFVGFVRAWHGLDAVISAIADDRSGRSLALTVVGDGPARPDLERQAAAQGIAERVRFLGVVPHDRIADAVAGFDIALQPKVVHYASPLKAFDYMAAGRAIVAPDQPNIREILEHETTALLFDPEREGAMWEAIERLIDRPDLRLRLGEAARAELKRSNRTWMGNVQRIVAWAARDAQTRAARPERS